MKTNNNRLDFIRHISIDDAETFEKTFKSYIPDHYEEIYTLYGLLIDADVDYTEVVFKKPIIEDGCFIFVCRLSAKDAHKLHTAINNYGGVVKFMRNKSYDVSLTMTEDKTYIKFS